MNDHQTENTGQSSSKKFLHLLDKAPSRAFYGDEYELGGMLWTGYSLVDHDYITTHAAEHEILDVAKDYDGSAFHWAWSLKIADGVYVRHQGKANDVEKACTAALKYRPRVLLFDYMNRVTRWYETEPGSLYAVVDGEEAAIRNYGEGNYRFTRKWALGKPVFDCLSMFHEGLSGEAPTQEKAMIACVDAPERFKMACAALVANLRIGEVSA